MYFLKNKFLYIPIIAIGVFCALYAIVCDRILYADGGLFLYDIITNHISPSSFPHIRYTGFIFQHPSILLAKYDFNLLAKYTYASIYHFLSISVLFLILFRQSQGQRLLIFLGFWLAILPGMPFPVNYASESVLFGWLLYIIICNKRFNYRSLSFVLVLCGLMNISYETNIIFYFPLLALIFLRRKAYVNFNYKIIFALISFFLCLKFLGNLFTTQQLINTPVYLNFKSAFTYAYPITKSPFIYALLLLPPSLLIKHKNLRIFSIFTIMITFTILTIQVPVDILIFTAHSFRSFIVPLNAFLMVFALIHQFSIYKLQLGKPVIIVIIGCILSSTYRDILTTHHWQKGIIKLESIISTNKECTTLNEETANNHIYEHGFMDQTIAKTSILLQMGKKIKTIILPGIREYDLLKGVNYCNNYHEDKKLYVIQYKGGYFPDTMSFNNEFIKKNLGFNPKRKVYTTKSLQDCSTNSIINFTNDSIYIKNNLGEGTFNFQFTANKNPSINTSLNLTRNRELIATIKLNSKITKLDVHLNSNDSIQINKVKHIWSKDTYHQNTNFFTLKCTSTKEKN